MIRLSIAAFALATVAAPALAETVTIAPGEGAQERLQEALILARPGDEIVLAAGRFAMTDGLSLDVDNVTLRGAGMEASVLDFTGQQGSGEGLLVTSDGVTLRDFAIENPKGDGIKSKGADDIVYHAIRVTWTGGPKASNGAYGIYPVESTNILVDGSEVSGASDAGIYVGQSRKITVRNSVATDNVAGIEIENSRDAIVERNFVSRNTGGILVFDLPDLPVMGGGNVLVRNNLVASNTTANFAPEGNIVASVPRGTGIMVMANENVWVGQNLLYDNPTAPVMVIAYPMPFEDPDYNPYPREVTIDWNMVDEGGTDPQLEGAAQLVAAFGGTLPPVMWDGLEAGDGRETLRVHPEMAGWSLNLAAQGGGMANARPGPLAAGVPGQPISIEGWGAGPELEARIK
ncbi:parallel beta-helix domain-containing protein [Pelagerythrobacter marensis]|uniref:Parallel beta-helix domain-containing protein n=1 Tax=Pelagerythrobacter marensis TaxID=543877 RepID=A0ABZ2D0Z6_9SPHN